LEELKKARSAKRTVAEKVMISGIIGAVGVIVFILLKLDHS